MARHRSPGGRGTVSAYLPTPDARRVKSELASSATPFRPPAYPGPAHPVPSYEAPTPAPAARPASARPAPAGSAPAADPAAPGYAAYPAYPARDYPRRASQPPRRRAAVRPPSVRANTVVSATAALGAVVTGSFMAVGASGGSGAPVADAAEATLPPATLAAASQPLHVQPAAAASPVETASTVTALLPVAVPGDRSEALDKQDVEALHKGEALAAEAAMAHAKAVKEAMVLAGGGGLDDWIEVALDKLNLPQALAGGVKRVIMYESRGNPHAINLSDSNALAGRPSQGLMQVIPSTFRAYVLPELANRPITDPVANITAGVRYMIANYGMGTLQAGGRYVGGHYVGY